MANSSLERIRQLRAEQWFIDRGDETHRVDYNNLSSNSIVFDLGGYKGEWAKKIYDKYRCKIFVFEPVKSFYEIITKQFDGNSEVQVFNFGLGHEDFEAIIEVDADASRMSTEKSYGAREVIYIKSFSEFVKEHSIKNIDLMKVNIEGAEYDLMDSILENGFISIVGNLQIQFHDFEDIHLQRMRSIQSSLRATHCLSYQYHFVWENWTRKDLVTFEEMEKYLLFFQKSNLLNSIAKAEKGIQLLEIQDSLSQLRKEHSDLREQFYTVVNSVDYRWGNRFVNLLRKLKGKKVNG